MYPMKTGTENALKSGNFSQRCFRVCVWTVKTECFENDEFTASNLAPDKNVFTATLLSLRHKTDLILVFSFR